MFGAFFDSFVAFFDFGVSLILTFEDGASSVFVKVVGVIGAILNLLTVGFANA